MTRATSDDPIRKWSSRLIRPEIVFTTDTSPGETVDVLASAMTGQGFTIKDRTDGGYRAVLNPWRQWLTLNPADRLKIDVAAAPTGAIVSVRDRGAGFGPQKTTATALNAAVAELRRTGVSVSWSEWSDAARG